MAVGRQFRIKGGKNRLTLGSDLVSIQISNKNPTIYLKKFPILLFDLL